MSWNTGLNGPALNIAACTHNPLRVMAGPGTGKTYAMKRRVARLLEQDRITPVRILAVTFTRVAAADLVKELRNLGIQGCEQIKSGTLHAFCFSLLMQQRVFTYLGRYPRPILTFLKSGVMQFEAQPVLEDIKDNANFGTKRDCTRRIQAFEAAWARLQSDNPGWPQDPVDRDFHNTLIDWLTFHEAILIGELVPLALDFLRNNPACSELSAYDHVIVDEYQDLNKAEQTLIDLLASNANNAIIGDSDQSIYKFRYAHPEGILEFHNTHPTTHDEQLIECRRCPTRVVAIADSLIRNNYTNFSGWRLTPLSSNPEGEVYIVQWDDLEQETLHVANYVKHLINDRNYQPGDILILSPRSIIGCSIRDKLLELGIPTHSFYSEELLKSDQSQRSFSLLNLSVNPNDRVALRFWLGFGSQTWLKNQYSKLRIRCEQDSLSPKTLLYQILSGQTRLNGVSRIIQKYRELLSELANLNPLLGRDLVDYLFPENNNEVSDIRKLALQFVNDNTNALELLQNLRINISQPEIPIEGEFVRIMSLHKSKGLTSKVVIVSGCIHGLIPSIDNEHTPQEARENLMEQRRLFLFYVSITRCKEILVLSSSRMMKRDLAHRMGAILRGGGGAYGTAIASKFLPELGTDAPTPLRGLDWVNNRYVEI